MREDIETKTAFAIAWLREPEDAFKAAMVVFGMDTNAALLASTKWTNDADVLRIRDELLDEHGEDAFLPSKEDAIRLAWKMANNEYAGTKDRVAALHVFSELRGYITKGATNVNIDQSKTVTHNVLQVPMPATTAEWQEKAKVQQRMLVENARSTH